MKFFAHIRRQRGALACLVCLALIAVSVDFGAAELNRRRSGESPSLRIDEPQALEQGEDIDGREDWFTFQRAYPFDSIPEDARRLARITSPQTRMNSTASHSLEPSATNRWREIGPTPTTPAFAANWGLTSGRVNALAVSPANSRIVIAGSSTGGIWRSNDGGDTFSPVSDDQVDLAIGSIAFSRSNSSIVYAGMGDTKLGYLGSGVLKSTDAGATWSRVSNSSLPAPGTISRVEVDPSDSNRVYVAQYARLAAGLQTSSGIYISTDGGVSWTRSLAGGGRDVVVDPGNSQVIYAGLHRIDPINDPIPGLYRSTDRGQSWTNLFTNQYSLTQRRDIRIAISPVDRMKIYVLMGGSLGASVEARIISSVDGGATWNNRVAGGFDTGQLGYNSYLAADPRDSSTLYLGSRDLYRSTDAGLTWLNLTQNFSEGFYDYSPYSSKAHPDQHTIAFTPDNPGRFFIGNDGGVYRTNDGGITFQSLNSTLSLTQFVGLALHPTDPSISYGGTQDNGTQKRSSESGWYEIATGDGGRSVIDAVDPSTVFVTYVRGAVYRFRNDGRYFEAQVGWTDTFGESFTAPRMAFYPPFAGNGADSTLYFGTWRLFISTNSGDTWGAPGGSTDLTKGINDKGIDVLSAIGVSRSNTSVVYTGSLQGRAMLSTDAGQTWRDITSGLPDRSITSINVDREHPSTAYVTFSGFNAGHVFRTTDTGATWTDLSGNLPNIPANTLLLDPFSAQTLYVGTDIGVFRSMTGGTTWDAFDKGMPPVIVQALAAQQSGLMQAATYGRGAFEIVLPSPPLITAAVFDGSKTVTIDGRGFGDSLRVLINGVDRSERIKSSSETSIRLKAKLKKLGLVQGDNTIQVIDSNDTPSNVFTLRL